MNLTGSPSICETCGLPYMVDGSCDIHMDPPTDYGRGFHRFCLACWLGMKSKDRLDTECAEVDGRVDASESFLPDSELPDVRELRRIFEKSFKPEEETVWHAFLERFGKSEGRICYYPSAGSDFRPLVYQQSAGMVELGLVTVKGDITRARADLFTSSIYAAPDLWIFSDFRGDHLTGWLESKVVHSDEQVEIRLLAHTEIHPLRMDFQQRPSRAYTSLPPTQMTGRVFHLKLAVANATTGAVEVDVLYFCVENVNLIKSCLLRKQIRLTHLVWVRDGAGFGGGRMRHDFLIPLLTLFKTRWLFISQHYHQSLGQVRWPRELRFHEETLAGKIPDLHTIGSLQSGDDRVVFCEVDSSQAQMSVRMQKKLRAERMKPEVQAPKKPSVYLWLCCEGWMKFGPFEWLRFDDELQAILGPDGEEIAKKTDAYWRVSEGRSKGMGFSNPTITNSPVHPHRNCGYHPGKI